MTEKDTEGSKPGRRLPVKDRSNCCSDGEACCKDLFIFDIADDNRSNSDDSGDA